MDTDFSGSQMILHRRFCGHVGISPLDTALSATRKEPVQEVVNALRGKQQLTSASPQVEQSSHNHINFISSLSHSRNGLNNINLVTFYL